eukprot:gb/GECH01010466.1/.p1 GENE.gb/GECH01010466.1/~~gb/GECH01010466.1/.p1  ORF type:complete len:133 (+),score=21.30 gb/GECH01010466.1/:1-399(+)
MLSLISTFFVFVLGLCYPIYQSLKALSQGHDFCETQHWLSYWVVFGFLYAIEDLADEFLLMVPFYNIVKALFVVWLVTPWFKGSLHLYENLVEPILSDRQNRIDTVIGDVKKSALDAVSPANNIDQNKQQFN